MLEREHTRARFVFAALGIILVAAPLFDADALNWPVFWATAVAVGATAVASLVPAFWPALNRVGGLLIAGEIAAHVAATGGPASPYDVLYGMLLVYATMFYGTRRLITTAIVLIVLWVAPHVMAAGTSPEAHWRDVAGEIGVGAVIAVVGHGLMQRIWDQSADLAESEERYRCLFLDNPNGVFSLDGEGRFTSMNVAGARLLGVPPEQAIGLTGASQRYEVTVVNVRGRGTPARSRTCPSS